MRVNGNNMYDKIMYNKNIETMVSYFREGCKDTFIPYEKWVETIKTTVPPKFLEVNLKAFELGYNI